MLPVVGVGVGVEALDEEAVTVFMAVGVGCWVFCGEDERGPW